MTTSTVEPSLLELIGDIYDCVIDPSRWPATVERIRLRFGFHNAILGVNEGATGGAVLLVVRNVPPEMMPVLEELGHLSVDLWGGWSRLSTLPLEEPILQSDSGDPSTWQDNRYFQAFATPQGVVDTLALGLAMDDHTVASLAFGRHVSERPLTHAAMDELRILASHLRRAVVIGRMLDISAAAASNFAAALNAATAGVVLVDGAMRIVHANKAASNMLAGEDPIRTIAGKLELVSALTPDALSGAVQNATQPDIPGGNGIGILARRRDGRPLTVHVMPLEQRHAAGISPAAVAAIFIADAAAGASPPPDVLSTLYDLTPAEARIFAYTVEGKDNAGIGALLAIAPSTVKTHINRIYAKTGQHRRSDLVRLAAELRIPG